MLKILNFYHKLQLRNYLVAGIIMKHFIVQRSVEKNVKDAGYFGEHKSHYIKQKTVTVLECEQRRTKLISGQQFGSNLSFEYGYKHDKTEQHQKT